MSEQAVIHNTFVIERSYPATLERVFAAFSDPAKKRLWYAGSKTHEVEEFEMDFRPGGSERSRYRFGEGTPFPGVLLANDGTYMEIVPNRRVVMSSAMAIAGRFVSASLITFEFLPTSEGTDVIFTHQGVFGEGSGGAEMRAEGWQKMFGHLAETLER